MIYVFYSLVQKSFLKREANKICKSSLGEVNDFNYAKFDAKENTIKEIIDSCLEVPMLENKKVVVVEDAFFIASNKTKEKINKDNDYELLLKYLKKPCEETDLVFLVYSDKLDSKNEIYKALAKVAKIIPFAPLKEYDWEKYTRQIINKKGFNFDNDAIKELARRTLNDRDRLFNEIEKLSLYKNEISLYDVVSFVSEPLEDKVFELSNALLKGDSANALFIYRDLIKNKSNDPTIMLLMIASQFRFIYMCAHLKNKKKMNMDEIKNELDVKSDFRVRIALNNAKNIRVDLSNILEDIFQYDYKIKSGQLDHYFALELFIINFNKKYC